VLIAALVAGVAGAAPALTNALQDHPSPYLAMHADDPVAWQPWGAEALERAAREDRLVFVSVGYFACHWCHVMQRESYRDERIGAYINRHFLPIKVDRELHPALDTHLLDFVQRTRGFAGWPLNVFLTPEGYPVFGLVYLPPEEFLATLEELQALWADAQERQALRALAADAARELLGTPEPPDPELPAGLGERYQAALVDAALARADELLGGFGEQTKFPSVPQLRGLLQAYEHRSDPALRDFLELTLDQMAQLGLRDQIGGGFFRYVVTPDWREPHFEKMLYDNALLAELYLEAARVLERPDYRAVGHDTLDFMLGELWSPTGAFQSALSAIDEAGEEGAHYLWHPSTLEQLLSEEEREAAALAWGLRGPAPFDAGHLPVQAADAQQVAAALDRESDEVQTLLGAAREKLIAERALRELPRDEKLLAAWNGLALRALAYAAQGPGAERYRTPAEALRDFVANELWDGERLHRAHGPAGAEAEAALEDYAYVASGLLAWSALSGDPQDRALARRIAEAGWARFHGPGGWRLGEEALLPFAGGRPVLPDGPMPAPAAVLAETTLALTTPDEELHVRARAALNAGHAQVLKDPFAHATHIATVVRSEF
jgi:uncharacterized protein